MTESTRRGEIFRIYSHLEILVKVIQLAKDVYIKEAKNGKFKMEAWLVG